MKIWASKLGNFENGDSAPPEKRGYDIEVDFFIFFFFYAILLIIMKVIYRPYKTFHLFIFLQNDTINVKTVESL